jgi:hypothetical protein
MRVSPERALAAIRQATLGELPLTALLLMIRALPPLATARLRAPNRRRRLLDQLVSTPGFMALLTRTDLLAAGYTGQPWRLRATPRMLEGPEAFARFDEPGCAKVTMHFLAEPVGGGSRVVTETRIHLTDEWARRAFARYWFVVRHGSNLIRHEWLRAARRRATP